MKTILSQKLPRIIKNKARLEKLLGVKISNRGKEVFLKGEPENEYTAEKVIDALEFGFPYSTITLIKNHDFTFEILNIKDYTKRKTMKTIKARIIGKSGKTLQTLCNLTKCHFELKDNFIGIIGPAEYIENAQNAVISIVQGSKQGNVYSFLEKHQIKEPIDLGLKK